MSDTTEDKVWSWAFGVLAALALIALGAAWGGSYVADLNDDLESEAVNLGHAEWINVDGKARLRWRKSCEPKPSEDTPDAR